MKARQRTKKGKHNTFFPLLFADYRCKLRGEKTEENQEEKRKVPMNIREQIVAVVLD
jgi:hypothetical protein